MDNLSDHCPIYCRLRIADVNNTLNKSSFNSGPKPSWNNASDDQKREYIVNLERYLKLIEKPHGLVNCDDVHCCEQKHRLECDELMTNILETIDKTAMAHLTQKRFRKKKKEPIANWQTEIEPFKRDAQFWHSVWISAGRPVNNELHKLMKRTRNIYHLQIRKSKKAADVLKRNRLLDACINGKGDIYTEIRKMRKCPGSVVNAIDGVSTGISDHFASIYSELTLLTKRSS